MNSSAFPFLTDGFMWRDVPITVWLVAGIATMLVVLIRFGRPRGWSILAKYRAFWAIALLLTLIATAIIQFNLNEPFDYYLL